MKGFFMANNPILNIPTAPRVEDSDIVGFPLIDGAGNERTITFLELREYLMRRVGEDKPGPVG